MPDFTGHRVLIIGLAREGTALARFLAGRGARVTVTDHKPAEALAGNLAALAGLPIETVLGGHPASLLDTAEIVFVSPGVPLEIPLLVEARRRGLPLSTETRLFSRLCPAPIAGITGSSGKTTTTALVGRMLETGDGRTWVGGNIGRPLIGHLDEIAATHRVVMELSSFQLEFFGPWTAEAGCAGRGGPLFDAAGWSPPVAAVLNITPNHLDRHPSMAAYIAAKTHIVAYQRPGDLAVLGYDNPVTREMGRALPAARRVLWFSLEEEVAEGAYLRATDGGGRLILRVDGREETICTAGEVQLRGRHNLANLLAACAVAWAAGAPVEAMRHVATTFAGVEHRLELVRTLHGVRWYNDSIATTPERALAALRSFDEPIVLLAGGRDKHLPWEEMAALTWRKVHALILFGEAAGLIERAMAAARPASGAACQIHRAATLDEAVRVASGVAENGDVVLLSPGGTSFDAFADYAERGERYRALVQGLQ